MVFFNCNACGEALKKNQVDKHVLRCRHCQVLSCVDCGKDFWGDDYQSHTKCMTEEEKYCGKGYVPKVNKGEAKQEKWIERVQSAIAKASSPGLKSLLVRLKDYPNIPRKQQKFQNFLKNSLRVYSDALVTQVWDVLMAHSAQDDINKGSTETGTSQPETNGTSNGHAAATGDKHETDATNLSELKKSKRERKEERQHKSSKKEKKDRVEVVQDGEEQVKKSKKRKHKDEGVDENRSPMEGENFKVSHISTNEQPPKKKKKKKHHTEDRVPAEPETELNDTNDLENRQPGADELQSKKKKKFNWEVTITKILESKGEISLKKLRKKVLSEFVALDSANYSEENLWAKFDKKVRKMSTVHVFKERAKLKSDS